MTKKQLSRLLIQTIYLTFALIGFIGSFGYFKKELVEIYIYFTNLSNYICMGIILHRFILNIKAIINNEEYNPAPSVLSFFAAIYILITFMVFNFVLAPQDTFINYIFNYQSLVMHVVLPVLYIVYWILYENKSNITFKNAQIVVAFPIIYVIYILIRSRFLVGTNTKLLIYPYFFLNIEKLGLIGVMLYILGLVVIFLLITNISVLIINKKKKSRE